MVTTPPNTPVFGSSGTVERWALAVTWWSLATLVACAPPESVSPVSQEIHGEAFGTTWTAKWVVWEPGPSVDAEGLRNAITGALQEVDARMSTWRSDSELQAVREGSGPVVVSEETLEVVQAALQLAQATGGAFDPTVEPLMELWGFRGERRTTPPTDAEIEAARAATGWAKVVLGRDEGRPTIDAKGTALDLSAIAKGHAVDRAAAVMSEWGLTDFMVEIGGEVRAHGRTPRGSWRLGVDAPDEGAAPGAQFAAIVELRNAALATSGNYRNAYDAGGVRVVHTMDPRQGRPYESVVASASVVATDCRTADGWATALMVLGPDQGLAAVEARPGVEALLLMGTETGFVERRSSGMEAWLLPGSGSENAR